MVDSGRQGEPMPRHPRGAQAWPTIWRVPAPVWAQIAPLRTARDPPRRPGDDPPAGPGGSRGTSAPPSFPATVRSIGRSTRSVRSALGHGDHGVRHVGRGQAADGARGKARSGRPCGPYRSGHEWRDAEPARRADRCGPRPSTPGWLSRYWSATSRRPPTTLPCSHSPASSAGSVEFTGYVFGDSFLAALSLPHCGGVCLCAGAKSVHTEQTTGGPRRGVRGGGTSRNPPTPDWPTCFQPPPLAVHWRGRGRHAPAGKTVTQLTAIAAWAKSVTASGSGSISSAAAYTPGRLVSIRTVTRRCRFRSVAHRHLFHLGRRPS